MLQGAYPYHVDDKGRLKLPGELALALGSSFTLTRGKDGCLWLMPQEEWEALNARLRGDSLLDPRQLALQRYFIGSAVTLTLDGQGRFTIPPVLREAAAIQHEVMLVGIGTRVEVWSRERWNAYESRLSDEVIEELGRSVGI